MRRSLVPWAKIRILVTGCRGKSSLVRLLLAGLWAHEINAKGRITGVTPRELSISAEREILRFASAHVEEMRWWLKGLSQSTEAVVMENSAISPQLQPLAAHWLCPTLILWNNAREDHQEAWGYGPQAAAQALLRGIPSEGALLLGGELSENQRILWALEGRSGTLTLSGGSWGNYRKENISFAMEALQLLGLASEEALRAMEALPPDLADFRVFHLGESDLAFAFAANDLHSAQQLFFLLKWNIRETTLLYADRSDRGGRQKSFAPLLALPWASVEKVSCEESVEILLKTINGKTRVFGCGNVAGAPLALVRRLIGGGVPWTIPNM